MTPSKNRSIHEAIGHLLDKAHELKKLPGGGPAVAKAYTKLAGALVRAA